MTRDIHEFKPILSEIEESPVSPLGRTTFWIVVAILLFTTGWLYFGKVDIVITARGKIIPEGKAKILQPMESGSIRTILVKEGDYVRKGQVLMEIDPSITEPVLVSTEENLAYTQLEIERLEANLVQGGFYPDHGHHDMKSIEIQQNLYEATRRELQEQLKSKEQELLQVNQQAAATQGDRVYLLRMKEMKQAKLERLTSVKDIIPKKEYEQAEEDFLSTSARLEETTHKIEELSHRTQQIQNELSYIQENYNNRLLKDLTEKKKQLIELDARNKEIGFRHAMQQLRSPVDGYISELFIHTQGGVVTPAEKLLSVVPTNTPLLIEATILNKDVGYAKPGQFVAIKVDTFDFQKYGTIPGQLTSISKDSHTDNQNGEVYTIIVQPKKRTLTVSGKTAPLTVGMSVTSEIKVGQRRIIEFFIYPLIKALSESVSVR